jgi:HSP20 family molecular chaperone IbpA
MYRNQKDGMAANSKKLYPHFELEIAMPDISKENLEVYLNEDVLTMRSVKEKEDNPLPEYIVKGLDLNFIGRKF